MNLQSFIKHSIGKWIVQRTTYNFILNSIINLNSEVTVKKNFNRKIKEKHYNQYNAKNYIILLLTWGKNLLKNNIIIQPDQNNLKKHTGKILGLNTSYDVYTHKIYYFHTNNSFNTQSNNSKFYIHEKLWFINDNLALGISIIKYNNHCVTISFESRIRI